MRFSQTNRNGVVREVLSGTEFLHPSIHPLSKTLLAQEMEGYVIEPYTPPTAEELRRIAYSSISQAFVNEAVAEFLLENRTDKLDQLKALRASIRERYPKQT